MLDAIVTTAGGALVLIVSTLDSLPDAFRAALAAAILAVAVHRTSNRVPERLTGFAIAQCKTWMLVLMVVPAIVYVTPTVRFDVMVEAVPEKFPIPPAVGWALMALWIGGSLVRGTALVQELRATNAELGELEIADDTLHGRVSHWLERLRINREVTVGFAGVSDRPWTTGIRHSRIVLPNAARQWPAPIVDALILHELCHVKKHHWTWLVASRLVTAAYWPTPWVGRLTEQLAVLFQQRADALASLCYGDALGYSRALQHVRQRLDPPTLATRTRAAPPLLVWGGEASITHRESEALGKNDGDPHYDRVFWAVVQATLVALLIAGPTLREPPEEIEYEPLADDWQQVIHRAPEMTDTPIELRR